MEREGHMAPCCGVLHVSYGNWMQGTLIRWVHTPGHVTQQQNTLEGSLSSQQNTLAAEVFASSRLRTLHQWRHLAFDLGTLHR